MMTRTKMWRLAGPLAVGVLSLAGAASAQPGGEPPLAQNPPNTNGGGRPDWRNMTPEQREAAQAQMRERGLRQGLSAMGFVQTDVQDALVEFVAAQDVATRPLQDKARALVTAMFNKDTPDAQIVALAADYRALATAEQARRVTALADLDTSISYSKNPRLLAILEITGIVGDQGSLLNPPGAGLMALMGGGGRGGRGGPGGFGGFGGPGGPGGGGRGGRGGQNGGANNGNNQ